MKIKHIPFILLFSIPSFVIGQKSIPGYLGKKNCLSLNYIGGIVKKDPLVSHDQYYSQNPNLQITFERVLNRKKTILLSVSNGGFRVDNEYLYDLFDNDGIIHDDGKFYTIYDGVIDFNVTSFHLSCQVYFRNNGAVAPLGKYFVYGLSQSIINIKEVDVLYSMNSSTRVKLPNITHTSTSLSTFFIGFGSKRFIDNSIFINKMIQFNLPLNFYTPQLEERFMLANVIPRGDLENKIAKLAFSRQNTLNFSIGIGAAF